MTRPVQLLSQLFLRWALRKKSPEPAPVRLTQHRIYVLPTRAGFAFAAVLLAMLLGSINYGLSLGFLVTFLLAGLGLSALLQTFRNLAGLTLRPGRCEPAFAGDPLAFHLLLGSDRPRTRFAIRLSLPGQPAWEVDVAPEGAELALPWLAGHRGRHPLPPITLETTYPLGLVRAWAYALPAQEGIAYPVPARHAPPWPPWPPGQAATGTDVSAHGRGEDFAGLRRHQLTDAPGHVAWKAAARQADEQPLLTKQFTGASSETLRFSLAALPATLDLESRLSILCRWVLQAHQWHLRWSLILPGQCLGPDCGEPHLARCLRVLALHGQTD